MPRATGPHDWESTMDLARNPPSTMITALFAALALALLALAIATALPGLAADLAGNGWHKASGAPVAGNGWHNKVAVTLAGNGWHSSTTLGNGWH